MVSLGVAYLSFGPGRRVLESPTMIPAAMMTSPTTVTSPVAIETLLVNSMDALPIGHGIVGVHQWTLRPGPMALTLPAFRGPAIVFVESGKLTATAAGTETPISAGDTFAPADQEVALRLAGSEDATLFVVYVVPSLIESPGSEKEILFWRHDPVTQHPEFLISSANEALPGGSGRLVLERMTLPPGSALPPEEAHPFVWTEVGKGALGLTLEGEHLPFRWVSGDERTFRQAQRLPVVPVGTRMTLRNVDDVPLILYRLTLTPMFTGASTAMAGKPAP
jgi:hypothetical protein